MNCLNCKEELTNPRAKYCSDKCRMAYTRRTPEQIKANKQPEQPTRTEEPEQVPEKPITAVNTIPLSKGGKWEPVHPYKENPGMCKYCGKMTYLIDNITVDEMVECCHKCASLKNER